MNLEVDVMCLLDNSRVDAFGHTGSPTQVSLDPMGNMHEFNDLTWQVQGSSTFDAH